MVRVCVGGKAPWVQHAAGWEARLCKCGMEALLLHFLPLAPA